MLQQEGGAESTHENEGKICIGASIPRTEASLGSSLKSLHLITVHHYLLHIALGVLLRRMACSCLLSASSLATSCCASSSMSLQLLSSCCS